jgi:hypothetical protein
MNKRLLVIVLVFIACFSFIYAATEKQETSTTLDIKAYKLGDLPQDGILRVYVYNTSSNEQSSTTQVENQLDITSYLKDYISGFRNVFSIKIQTNLVSSISVVINFSPFTSQDKTKTSISTSYYLDTTTAAGSYTNASSKRDSSSSYYYYKYSASMTTKPTSFEDSSSGTTVSTGASSATVSQSISAKRNKYGTNDYYFNYWGEDYALSSKTTLDNIDSNKTVDSTIYVYMKLNDITYEGIVANVQYVAPVKITVTTE